MKPIELIIPHEHAGVSHSPCAVITVPAETAAYLEEHGIGKIVVVENIKKDKPKEGLKK